MHNKYANSNSKTARASENLVKVVGLILRGRRCFLEFPLYRASFSTFFPFSVSLGASSRLSGEKDEDAG